MYADSQPDLTCFYNETKLIVLRYVIILQRIAKSQFQVHEIIVLHAKIGSVTDSFKNSYITEFLLLSTNKT